MPNEKTKVTVHLKQGTSAWEYLLDELSKYDMHNRELAKEVCLHANLHLDSDDRARFLNDMSFRKEFMEPYLLSHEIAVLQSHIQNAQDAKSEHELAPGRLADLLGDSKPKVHLPPGHRSGKVLRFLFPKKAFERIFAQVITDMREEHAEALEEGSDIKATWITVRGNVDLWLTSLFYIFSTFGKKLQGVWKSVQ